MGKIEDGYLRGLVGSVITRKVGDTNVVQGHPRFRLKQSEATKAAGIDFGTASRCAARIRYGFSSLILGNQDGGMINRLNAQVLRAMRANRSQQLGTLQLAGGKLHRLIDFQFNAKCHLQDYLFVDVEATYDPVEGVAIRIPAFHSERDLLHVGRATHCSIRLRVVAFDFADPSKKVLGGMEHEIPLRTGDKEVLEQKRLFKISEPAGTIVLVGVGLQFLYQAGSRFQLLNSKELNPAAIVAAFVV